MMSSVNPLQWSILIRDSNLFYSIRYANRFESIRLVKKLAFRFASCHAVFLVYLLYSRSQKNKLTSLFAAFNTLDVFNLLEIV